ncbi:MAG TPA: hypothetical protein VIK04_21160, partial [Solirubrobacteraceae bacterium]
MRLRAKPSLEEPELDRDIPLNGAAIVRDGRQRLIEIGEQRGLVRCGDARQVLRHDRSRHRRQRRRVLHLENDPGGDRAVL